MVDAWASPATSLVAPSSPVVKERFFALGKARVYNGSALGKSSLPAAGRVRMAVIGDGKYFPLPREKPAVLPLAPRSARNLAAGDTKPLPQTQARHILSLFSPEELD